MTTLTSTLIVTTPLTMTKPQSIIVASNMPPSPLSPTSDSPQNTPLISARKN